MIVIILAAAAGGGWLLYRASRNICHSIPHSNDDMVFF